LKSTEDEMNTLQKFSCWCKNDILFESK